MAHLNGSFVQVARTSLLATSDLRLAFRGDSKCDVRRVSSQRATCDVRRATCSSPTRQRDLCAARQTDLFGSSKRPVRLVKQTCVARERDPLFGSSKRPVWLVKETLSLARQRDLCGSSKRPSLWLVTEVRRRGLFDLCDSLTSVTSRHLCDDSPTAASTTQSSPL